VRKLVRSIAVLVGVGLTLSPSAFANSAGLLSSSEYQELSALSMRLKPEHNAAAKIVAACEKTRAVSPLVVAIRSACASTAEETADALGVGSSDSHCHKHHPAHVYACALPTYSRLGAATSSLYRANSTARRIAASRGFVSACVTGLSDPADVVALERQMVSTTAAMVADVRHQDGKALIADSNSYSEEFGKAADELDRIDPAVNLSACKHA
jgi:hypothetical protein